MHLKKLKVKCKFKYEIGTEAQTLSQAKKLRKNCRPLY